MSNGLIFGNKVTLYTDQGSNPAIPAAGAGKDIRSLRGTSQPAPKYVLLELERGAGAACTLIGPVKLYAERAGKVRQCCILNGGANIVLDNPPGGAGWSDFLQGIALNDRIEIVAGGAIAAGNFSASITAVEGSP